jgi:hypothetical protein
MRVSASRDTRHERTSCPSLSTFFSSMRRSFCRSPAWSPASPIFFGGQFHSRAFVAACAWRRSSSRGPHARGCRRPAPRHHHGVVHHFLERHLSVPHRPLRLRVRAHRVDRFGYARPDDRPWIFSRYEAFESAPCDDGRCFVAVLLQQQLGQTLNLGTACARFPPSGISLAAHARGPPPGRSDAWSRGRRQWRPIHQRRRSHALVLIVKV